jgi:hypothetical protein
VRHAVLFLQGGPTDQDGDAAPLLPHILLSCRPLVVIIAAALQEAGRRPDLHRAAAHVAELQREFVRVRAALEAVLQQAGAG